MFGIIWSLIGLAIVLTVLADAFWTILTVSGAGWISTYVAGSVGRVAMRGPKHVAENASLLALGASFFLWLVLLWVGWTLFFCGSPSAVLDASTKSPADLVGRIYYAGFTLTTLGVGDFEPGEGLWQCATVVAATSGFVVLTLFITYALSVMTALNERRTLGAAVGTFGPTPEDIVGPLATGGEQALSTRLLTFTDQLVSAAIQTDAFPVLEYSLVGNPKWSFARAVVTLGEVSLLLEHALDGKQRMSPLVWRPLQNAVTLMIREKHGGDHSKHRSQPPLPNLDCLETLGLTIASQAKARYHDSQTQELRARWLAWLHWHHREWSLVQKTSETT